jgi:hypothetical protein
MPAPHALYSKMLAERTASRNVLVLFHFIYFIYFYSDNDVVCGQDCVIDHIKIVSFRVFENIQNVLI